MRPPFQKASMKKECYEELLRCKVFLRLVFKDCTTPTPYDRFHCCLSPLAVELLELEILFLNWSF